MKYKTTKKALRANYNRIISIGYCGAQYLLQYERPRSYCARVEGWACDNYDIDGVLISTGYAPLAARNTASDWDRLQQYETDARRIMHEYGIDEDERRHRVTTLLRAFVAGAASCAN